MILSVVVLLLCTLLLFYVYGGYLLLLKTLVRLRGTPKAGLPAPRSEELPDLTVYFSALNEEHQIDERIENLLEQDYPPDRLEILVISDGSTDGTASRVRSAIRRHPSRRIRLIEFSENRGKAAAQNEAARAGASSILVSTDAGTRFAPGFLKAIAERFTDPKVAVAGGALSFRSVDSGIAEGIGTYRKMEMELRRYEDLLGVMAKTDAACTAYRKDIWDELEEFEDVDHVIVIQARKKGWVAAHVDDARAVDTPNSRWRQEIVARARMTRKGMLTIHKRWRWTDIRSDPYFSFALYSHRHARYFSPFYLIVFVAAAVHLAVASGAKVFLSLGGLLVAAAVAIHFFRAQPAVDRNARRIGSFVVGNAGFAWGVLRWLAGDRSGKFVPARTME